MAVTAIELLQRVPSEAAPVARKGGEEAEVPSFGETLKKFLADVNQLQLEAGEQMELMAAGQAENLHDVMIAAEKASISLELLMEIRNKVLEAYHELLRMQI